MAKRNDRKRSGHGIILDRFQIGPCIGEIWANQDLNDPLRVRFLREVKFEDGEVRAFAAFSRRDLKNLERVIQKAKKRFDDPAALLKSRNRSWYDWLRPKK